MNILALNWQDLSNPQAGGAEVHLEELLRRLVAMGHSVTLFCSNYPGGAPEETIEGLRIIRRGGRYDFNFIAPLALRRLVKKEKFDILIEDINKIPFYTPLFLNLPTLVVIPHLFASSVFQEINFVLGSYIYLAEKPMSKIYRQKKFNVISESTAADLCARGIPEENISIVHCGIDSQLYYHDSAVGKYERPSVVYLGRLKKYKSVQHLIEAVALLREEIADIRLTVIGAGDYLSELKKQVKQKNLQETVEFTGFVSAEEKVERLRKSHVCVCSSRKEGWGLTNIEANACGTAVIAANVEGLRDSVRDGDSGLLFEYGNITELTDKLRMTLTDQVARERLVEGGLRWAKQFDWDVAAAKFMEAVNECLAYENDRRKKAG